MKAQYDARVDALLYRTPAFRAGNSRSTRSHRRHSADYGPDGKLACIEFLNASKLLKQDESPAGARSIVGDGGIRNHARTLVQFYLEESMERHTGEEKLNA